MATKKFFYGTANLKLDIEIPIDPNYRNSKKFEFGDGFYLSPYENVAISYARNGILIKELEKDLNDEEIRKAIISGDIFKANIHIYEIDLDKVDESNSRLCNSVNKYEKILKETIEGYKTDDNYAPKEEYTYGMLCGKYWDDNVDEHIYEDGFEKMCKENMMKIVDDYGNEVNAKQLCLHHNRNCIKNHTHYTITKEII